MARIAGVNLPTQKRLVIGLTYIYGIGDSTAEKICRQLELDPDEKVRDLTDEEVTKLRNFIDSDLEVEGDLRRERAQAIKRLTEIGSLSRHQAPSRAPGARPADEDERPHAQGPEEDRRPRQEGDEVVAPPRNRGRTRRRVKKNIAIGQAHIKTSFNNTIVTLTDREGNVIVWESAGSAGFKGSRKSTPFAAQVTADSAARKGMEHGLQKVEVFVEGPRLRARDRDPLAPGCRPRDPRREGRHAAGAQRRPASEAEARLVARDLGPKCRLCRREGLKLFLKGERCLTEKCAVERRSLPAGRPRPRAHQAVRVPAPAAREAEGAAVLRPAREAVPQHVREGDTRAGGSGREPAPDARDAARQRRLPARLRRLARAGAAARSPQPLPRERPPREHPELRRAARRGDQPQAREARSSRSSATPPTSRRPSHRGSRPTTTASRGPCSSGRSAPRSTRPSRNRSSSSSTRSNAVWAGNAPPGLNEKGPLWLHAPA